MKYSKLDVAHTKMMKDDWELASLGSDPKDNEQLDSNNNLLQYFYEGSYHTFGGTSGEDSANPRLCEHLTHNSSQRISKQLFPGIVDNTHLCRPSRLHHHFS